MANPASPVSRLSPAVRLVLVVAALVTLILIPFLLWAEEIERAAPLLLTTPDAKWLVAGIGMALLMADLALPVPSSVVSVSLCLLLGPLLGAAVVATGMLGGFLCGYLVGRLLPRAALRRWVGSELWDAVSRRAERSGPLWILVTRPVPVLAEATAIISGSLGVPFRSALPAALLSSVGVACCYGAAALLGLSNGGFWLAFAMSLTLAGALWLTSRLWRGRMGTSEGT